MTEERIQIDGDSIVVVYFDLTQLQVFHTHTKLIIIVVYGFALSMMTASCDVLLYGFFEISEVLQRYYLLLSHCCLNSVFHRLFLNVFLSCTIYVLLAQVVCHLYIYIGERHVKSSSLREACFYNSVIVSFFPNWQTAQSL